MSGTHLVHGMGAALEAPTWPPIRPSEAEAVLACFADAGRLLDVTWHSPRPFSAAALLRTDVREFVLKRHHPALRSPTALAEEHAFMAHLRAAGLTVPDVMLTDGRASAISQDGWTYELHRKAGGLDLYRDRPSWTSFLSDQHAYAAGQALARLHQAAQSFGGAERSPHPLIASFTILPSLDPLAAAERYVAERPALAEFLADKPWHGDLTRLFDVHAQGLGERLARQPCLWTHNDWHPSNLLWSAQGQVTTVFDFGLAAPSCALLDLAIAIERTAVPWLDIGEGKLDAAGEAMTALRLLAGYREIRPLSAAEVATTIQLLPLVHLEFALSEVHYFAGILGDRAQAELAWHGYAIGHADWFLSQSGQMFIEQLKSGIAD